MPLPSVSTFSLAAMIAVIVIWAVILLLFTPILALNARRVYVRNPRFVFAPNFCARVPELIACHASRWSAPILMRLCLDALAV